MRTDRPDLGPEDLRALLSELGARLEAAGVHGDLYVVGGAAIALTLGVRRITRDVDAVFRPAVEVREEAERLAAERGLPRDWLDSAALAFAPNVPDTDAVSLDIPGLSVSVASPEHLLAMKLAAARPGRDIDDLVLLFDRLGIDRPERALAIAKRLYGQDSVVLSDPDESYLWLAEDVLAELRRRRGSGQGAATRPVRVPVAIAWRATSSSTCSEPRPRTRSSSA